MSVKRPSPEAYKQAIETARRMSESDVDPHHVAQSLQYLHARTRDLEALFRVTDRYLRFGTSEHELTEMRQLVTQLREEQQGSGEGDDVASTLPI